MVRITHVQTGDVTTPSGEPTLCALVHKARMKLVIYLLTHKEEEFLPEIKELIYGFLESLHDIQRAGFHMEDGLERRKMIMELHGLEETYQKAKKQFRESQKEKRNPKFI